MQVGPKKKMTTPITNTAVGSRETPRLAPPNCLTHTLDWQSSKGASSQVEDKRGHLVRGAWPHRGESTVFKMSEDFSYCKD